MRKRGRSAVLLAAALMWLCFAASNEVNAAEGLTDAEYLAKVMWTEARGESETRKAAVAWCVLNRVDSDMFPDTIKGVVTQSGQFAWRKNAPVTEELLKLAEDVLLRRELEKLGVGDAGRVLPADYLFFAEGRNGKNRFRKRYRSKGHWNWTLDSPYEEKFKEVRSNDQRAA